MLNRNIKMLNLRQDGFLSLPNDSIVKTLLVAIFLCLVCSVIVSTTATMLKPIQQNNKKLDKQKNILTVAGINDSNKSIEELFSQIDTKIVDLATGEYTTAVDVETFDQRKASKDPEFRVTLDSDLDIAQIGGHSKYANVYLVRDGDTISRIIIPVKGYGLWSTLYGFLCLEGDAQTACGINFYEHNETPGLGGEVDNPSWKAQWQGKQIFNAQGQPEIGLIKGLVVDTTPNPEYKIDGLAGATLTSNGVTNLVRFWVGENGFGPYLQKLREESKVQQFKQNQQASTELPLADVAEQADIVEQEVEQVVEQIQPEAEAVEINETEVAEPEVNYGE